MGYETGNGETAEKQGSRTCMHARTSGGGGVVHESCRVRIFYSRYCYLQTCAYILSFVGSGGVVDELIHTNTIDDEIMGSRGWDICDQSSGKRESMGGQEGI